MAHKSSLPAHYTEKEHRLSILASEIFDRYLRPSVDAMGRSRDPMRCESEMLGVLAREYSTDYWSDGMEEADKRSLCMSTVQLKRISGTPAALRYAYHTFRLRAEIVEWDKYGGGPYHFRIDLSAVRREITPRLVRRVRRVAAAYKNVRSVLDDIRLGYMVGTRVPTSAGTVAEVSAVVGMVEGYEYVGTTVVSTSAGAIAEVTAIVRNYEEVA